MTKQEAFNKVWQRAKDKRKSTITSSGFNPAYRSYDNRCCFIGALIPDEHYQPEFEGRVVSMAIKSAVPALRRLPVRFLCSLQGVHDNFPASLWEQKLREIANTYGLIVEE